MIHEVGHNHGREHSPCGNADGIDRNFPYKDGGIGSWGYDLVAGTMKSPDTYTDFMGYCERQWVSDYTYGGLFDWIRATNTAPDIWGIPTPWRSLFIDMNGDIRIGRVLTLETPPDGEPISVSLYDAQGTRVGETTGLFTHHAPLPGGIVLFSEPSTDIAFVTIGDKEPVAIH